MARHVRLQLDRNGSLGQLGDKSQIADREGVLKQKFGPRFP